ELAGLGSRLLIDVVAITALAIGLFYRRHRRSDLVVLYVVFNVGLFAAVVVISEGEVIAAVGFGLFAVLSIIRLRAEQLSFAEIAYFFASIVLGLVTAVDLGGAESTAALAALVLVAPAIIDHPGLLDASRRMELTLELVLADVDELRRAVEQRVGARVIALEVLDLDYVREVTRVEVHVIDRSPRATATYDGAVVK
ncbi:MAG TPA: DUF4956 domain-containing protein, partial [Solirubrobacteraceae bacterium]|nr:DUF4956 domain-containing protein [Solirubrobacteraceae bacterium]